MGSEPIDRAEAHLAQIAERGYTIVPEVFDAETASDLVGALDRIESDRGIVASDNSFEGRSTVRVYNLLSHGPRFEAIPVHAEVLRIVEGVLDPGCLVSSLSSIAIGAGETAQPIHADDQVLPLPKPHVATICNTMWALTDFTEANGATRVIPGSHLWDHSPTYGTHYDSEPAEMSRGSVLVWHGSLWHGGGANRTSERRYGIAMNYCAGWIRQQENQQLGLSLDTVRSFGPRLRELCGFGTYQLLIGHIEKQTPAQRFFDSEGSTSLFDVT